jgi:excisionase family DNA binding protein
MRSNPQRRVKVMSDDEILTAEEVAKIMKVNIRSVREWVSTGDLAIIMVGKREYRIRRSELNRFIQDREKRKEKE